MFTSSNHWSQFKYHSRTLIHTYMCVCNDSGREGTGTGEAYIALSLHVGSFVQEHLHHFNMTIHNGVVESSVFTLSETDTHCERAYIHTWTYIHATVGYIVHHDFTMHYTLQRYHSRRRGRPYTSSHKHYYIPRTYICNTVHIFKNLHR